MTTAYQWRGTPQWNPAAAFPRSGPGRYADPGTELYEHAQRVIPASCICHYHQTGKHRFRLFTKNPDCPWHTS